MNDQSMHDFIVVGSGAGGGPLAANLALAGVKVHLIEAGDDKINDHYSIPAFHPLSTEDPLLSWEFFVRHYSDDNRPDRDPKYHDDDPRMPSGIFYPRATGLGGCTTHHAMITVAPHDSDWDAIAATVRDSSWDCANMRKYFERLVRAEYQDRNGLLKILNLRVILGDLFAQSNDADEGRDQPAPKGGWLPVTQADPSLLLEDAQLRAIVKRAVKTALAAGLFPMPAFNPNYRSRLNRDLDGVNVIPISVENGTRAGARERILSTREHLNRLRGQGRSVGTLDISTNTFATEIVFADDDPCRAVGVRCVHGEALYEARHHTRAPGNKGESVVYLASKEVIICGGAFNTPQLLMLSGIGPKETLQFFDIPLRVESPGVGANLQDRYEVGVVVRTKAPFSLLEHATFTAPAAAGDRDPDPVYAQWRGCKEGIYATNGSVLGIVMRSSTRAKGDPPDLYIFGVPGYFRGYEVGYAQKAVTPKDCFTWAVLKGHTDNTSGYVTLRSADPFVRPEIHFKYFEESGQSDADDVRSVVDGVKFVQRINERLGKDAEIAEHIAPKPGEDLETFVRNNAWGHHASCTCKIGVDGDPTAVLDKDFQVRGTRNLRVVDASVFPRIPGLFILAAIYMISEKASDVIIERHRAGGIAKTA
jgi:choline dehydrogenase